MRTLLLFILIIFLTGCSTGEYREKSYSKKRETEKPIYINYPDSGFIKKFFNEDWEIIHDSTKASYYRLAHYSNGKPITGIPVKDYYISGEMQFDGYLLNESPDIPDKFCKWYFKNGNLSSTDNYKNGELNGKYREYYKGGNLRISTRYTNTKIHGGYLEYYDSTGSIYKKLN